MENLRDKSLWVMRHGQPDVARNPLLMTGQAFNEFLLAYDRAGLTPAERQRLIALYRQTPLPDLVISSDLPRAEDTARLFARGKPVILNPLFREVPVRVTEESPGFFRRHRWTQEMWWSYLRLAWFRNQQPEGRTESIARAREALQEVSAYQKDVERLAIVSHAGFLLVALNLLQREGQVKGRRFPHISFGKPTHYRWR